MTATPFDLAIFGSNFASALLAVLLAERHRKRVLLVVDASAPARLARGFDICGGTFTRPETWALVTEGKSETLALLRRDLGAAIEHVDPLFVAENTAGISALGHMRHVAQGFGHEFERVPFANGARQGVALKLRDAVRINRRPAMSGIRDWLARAGVRVAARHGCTIAIKRDGGAHIDVDGEKLNAAASVLADEEAVMTFAASEDLESAFVQHRLTGLLTCPASALPAPVIFDADAGLIASQSTGGAVTVIGGGAPDGATDALSRLVPPGFSARLAGRASFVQPRSRDGGPLVGPMRHSRTLVAVGFGPPGAFLMPALARFLVGESGPQESAWFADRALGKAAARARVAEFVPWAVPHGQAA